MGFLPAEASTSKIEADRASILLTCQHVLNSPISDSSRDAGAVQNREQCTICGFRLLAKPYSDCVEYLLDRLSRGRGAWVVTLNLEILSNARLDRDYRNLVQSADIVVADGMPFVWASRWKRGATRIPGRTTGADLSADLIRRVPAQKIAIIGGENPPKALLTLEVEHQHEVFIFDGKVPMRRDFIEGLAEQVRQHGATLIFVALGVPKQDFVAEILREQIPEAVILGVGGTFELIAGIKPRAPDWMQNYGLEWLFRLVNEPRRLWYRYLVIYWVGLASLSLDVMRSRSSRSWEPSEINRQRHQRNENAISQERSGDIAN